LSFAIQEQDTWINNFIIAYNHAVCLPVSLQEDLLILNSHIH